MKTAPFIFLLCLLGAFHATDLAGQSTGFLHLILSIDEQNEDMREGCRKDAQKTTSFFKEVAQSAGMPFKLHTLDFDQNKIYNFLQAFTCNSNDVVVFLYSGHGFRNEDDQVIWPLLYYCVNNSQSGPGGDLKSCGVPLDWIHKLLVSKQPRMSIAVGNSCNNVPDNEAANKLAAGLKKKDPDPADSDNLRNLQLLTNFSGHIVISGASPGQFSYTNDEDGSYFINEWVDVLADGLFYAENPTSWASILKKTRDSVQKKKPDQRPQFLIVEDHKKMFSEGKQKYESTPSYETLDVQAPAIDDTEYESWETDDFDSDDYSASWEAEYEGEEQDETALENLPVILLSALYVDDNQISDSEAGKIVELYVEVLEKYGYDRESAQIMLEYSMEILQRDMNEKTMDQYVQEFVGAIDLETRSWMTGKLRDLADSPDSAALTEFLDTLSH